MTGNTSDTSPAADRYHLLGHPTDLAGHLRSLGPLPMPKVLDRAWQESLHGALDESGLAGRGGAAFPTAIKLATARAGGRGGVIVVNGMEGEPASDKDKVLLTPSPHLVLDGAQLIGAACGADQVVVCVPIGRDAVAGSVTRAITERIASSHGVIPESVIRPPDRFVAGEESALAQWIGSGQSLPWFRPDKSIPLRIGKRPVLVHNTETLAHVAMIARRGPHAFRSCGMDEEPGTTLVTISGAVAHPGVVEVARGTTLRDIVARAAPFEAPSALLVGGFGGTWVGPEHFGMPYASISLRTIGASAGVGVVMALGPSDCGLAMSARIARYMAQQSSGQCGPCVFGLPAIADDLTLLAVGQVDPDLLLRLQRRLDAVDGRGACRHPDGVAGMVRSALTVFASDVVHHVEKAACALQTTVRRSDFSETISG
jgi:NADH:ubiquinone oxidoreductase subunit F (NADH-binding)